MLRAVASSVLYGVVDGAALDELARNLSTVQESEARLGPIAQLRLRVLEPIIQRRAEALLIEQLGNAYPPPDFGRSASIAPLDKTWGRPITGGEVTPLDKTWGRPITGGEVTPLDKTWGRPITGGEVTPL